MSVLLSLGSNGTKITCWKTTSLYRQYDCLGNILLRNNGTNHSHERYFVSYSNIIEHLVQWYTLSWQQSSTITVASFSRTMCPATLQKWFQVHKRLHYVALATNLFRCQLPMKCMGQKQQLNNWLLILRTRTKKLQSCRIYA